MLLNLNNLHKIITTQQNPSLGKSLDNFLSTNILDFKKVLFKSGGALGGISVCEAFWLYFMIKSLKPKQIIESGTFYGYSLYFIVSAVNWECRIISFDIDQSHTPKYDGVEFYECDWIECNKDFLEGEGTMIFFDDHIDQDKRLEESIARNQKHIFFHDNYLSLNHSHKPIRFCDLKDAKFCYTFNPIYSDPIFTDTSKNVQSYRWLTYIER